MWGACAPFAKPFAAGKPDPAAAARVAETRRRGRRAAPRAWPSSIADGRAGAAWSLAVETASDAAIAAPDARRPGRRGRLPLTHARAATLKIRLYTPEVVAVPRRGRTGAPITCAPLPIPPPIMADAAQGPLRRRAAKRCPAAPRPRSSWPSWPGLLPATLIWPAQGRQTRHGRQSRPATIAAYEDDNVRRCAWSSRARVPLDGAEHDRDRRLPPRRRRARALRHHHQCARAARAGADAAAFGMLHRRSSGLAQMRLRRPAARRHRGHLASPAAASCSISRRRAGASASSTSSGPIACRIRASTPSRPMSGWASMPMSGSMAWPRACCGLLGYGAVRLLTNNPDKVAALEAAGDRRHRARAPRLPGQRAQPRLSEDQGREGRPSRSERHEWRGRFCPVPARHTAENPGIPQAFRWQAACFAPAMSVPGSAHGIQSSFLATMTCARPCRAQAQSGHAVTPSAGNADRSRTGSGRARSFDDFLDIINPLQHHPGGLHALSRHHRRQDRRRRTGGRRHALWRADRAGLLDRQSRSSRMRPERISATRCWPGVEDATGITTISRPRSPMQSANGGTAQRRPQAAPTMVAALTPASDKPRDSAGRQRHRHRPPATPGLGAYPRRRRCWPIRAASWPRSRPRASIPHSGCARCRPMRNRWDLIAAKRRSAVIARAEQGAADAHMGGAEFHRRFEIPAHAHAETGQAVLARELGQQRKMRRRILARPAECTSALRPAISIRRGTAR